MEDKEHYQLLQMLGLKKMELQDLIGEQATLEIEIEELEDKLEEMEK